MHQNSDRVTQAFYELHQQVSEVLALKGAEIRDLAYNDGVNLHYDDHCLVNTIRANVDNEQLTDAEFREFVRNSV